ncbi:predicted protein [Postia placenta Mad-698-R]|nr:predicted protein [Postia placenta Mad-698-R]
MSMICHQASGVRADADVAGAGAARPVTEGSGAADVVPEGVVMTVSTRSERQTPSPAMTLLEPLQPAATQVPPRRTWLELEHARQALGPAPEQLEQLESQDWQEEDVVSKNCDWAQVGRQRPFVSTGRSELQLEHWLKEPPEHVAQSGWHARHEPEELKVLDGHEETHDPLDASLLLAQVKQKVDDPAQVLQEESQAMTEVLVHCSYQNLGKHTGASQVIRRAQELKFGISHFVHLAGQPVIYGDKKYPVAHFAQAVPLDVVVHPALHEQAPSEPQTPLTQSQLDGGLLISGTRHFPVPCKPWSHFSQPAGQGWHVGPKNPSAQDSHEEPVKPVGQTHLPAVEHTPAPAHGGEHAEDCISSSARGLFSVLDGSCDTSGTESQKMTRSFEEEPANDAHMLDARAKEPAELCVCLELFAEEPLVGNAVKVAWPEKFALGYNAIPGCSSTFSGSETDGLAEKPGDAESEALEDVRISWRSAGLVVEEYCPGSKRRLVVAPDADRVAPTAKCQDAGQTWEQLGKLTRCVRESFEALAGNADDRHGLRSCVSWVLTNRRAVKEWDGKKAREHVVQAKGGREWREEKDEQRGKASSAPEIDCMDFIAMVRLLLTMLLSFASLLYSTHCSILGKRLAQFGNRRPQASIDALTLSKDRSDKRSCTSELELLQITFIVFLR